MCRMKHWVLPCFQGVNGLTAAVLCLKMTKLSRAMIKKKHQRIDNTLRPVHEPKEGQVKITGSTKGMYFHFVLDSLYTRN